MYVFVLPLLSTADAGLEGGRLGSERVKSMSIVLMKISTHQGYCTDEDQHASRILY
jgi:hypothetical protein